MEKTKLSDDPENDIFDEKNLMNAKKYTKRDLRTQIYESPDWVLGSAKKHYRREKLYNACNKVYEKLVSSPPCITQIFNELISNCADNIIRSRKVGIPEYPAKRENAAAIEVTLSEDRKTITIKNYGEPVPVELYEDGNWVPYVIFGTCLSSSNYNGERTGAGKNGIGAKGGNILSKFFKLLLVDGIRGKMYEQIFRNNMTEASEAKVTEVPKGTLSYTEISYTLDFERFDIEEYDDDMIDQFKHIVLFHSWTMKTITKFDEEMFDNQHIVQYASLCVPKEKLENCIVHYEYEDTSLIETKKKKLKEFSNKMYPTPCYKKGWGKTSLEKHIRPKAEVLYFDTGAEGAGNVISFANSLLTSEGGIHVEKVYENIVPYFIEKLSEKEGEGNGKSTEGSKLSKNHQNAQNGKKISRIRPAEIKPLISAIFLVNVSDPEFNGQTKTKLTSPAPKIKIPKEELAPVKTWVLLRRLQVTLQAIKEANLSLTDGKKVKDIVTGKGLDATWAGTKRSAETTLILVEGDSAWNYAIYAMSHIEKGRKKIGVLAERGKFINTRACREGNSGKKQEKLLKNKEIANIKKFLGLQEGEDYSELEDARKKLRYGQVLIMCDADDDGAHITSLLLNFFDDRFPGLLQCGFVRNYKTKFMKLTKRGQKPLYFYTQYEFDVWKEKTRDSGDWQALYYKGLGTTPKEEIAEDMKNPIYCDFVYDNQAKEMFEVLFSKKRIRDRKKFIEETRKVKNEHLLSTKMTFTSFFEKEFFLYILASLERAIPKTSDGLKKSHLQIIWGAMQHWKAGKGPYKTLKVAQFSGVVAQHVSYHHNEDCIAKTTVTLARNYVGTNNLPMLVDNGLFGSRFSPKPSSARYIFTHPTKWMKMVFKPEDECVLKRLRDEQNEEVEPKSFYPILPILVCNGGDGIATGYSSSFLNYNPIEVLEWIKMYLKIRFMKGKESEKLWDLVPWYKGYTGKINLVKNYPIQSADETCLDSEYVDSYEDDQDGSHSDEDHAAQWDEDLELEKEASKMIRRGNKTIYVADRVIIKGVYKKISNDEVMITEIPVGTSTIAYIRWLDGLKQKKIIKSYEDGSDPYKVEILVTGMNKPDISKLGLVKKIKMTNMVALDETGRPRRYNNIKEFLEVFSVIRYRKYEERKEKVIEQMKEVFKEEEELCRYINLLVTGKLVVKNRPESEVFAELDRHGIRRSLAKKPTVFDQTKEKVEKLRKNLLKMENDLLVYEKMSPAELWLKELDEIEIELRKDPGFIRKDKPLIFDHLTTFKEELIGSPR